MEKAGTKSAAAAPRLLLRRIREALAREGDGQTRLDRIVKLIATNMVAEVCSIYLIGRDERRLELYATEGLNPEAVHRATLAIGEGLVGRIAETGRPINTDDAAATPGFRFIPGTGEEIYRSFLGAPIRRQGHTLGVLVVQNKAPRRYDEEEVDALELIATVIAEMTDAGALPAPADRRPDGRRRPVALSGFAAAEGAAIGQVVLHEPKIVLANPIAEDVETERRRLQAGMAALRGEVDKLIDGDGPKDGRGVALGLPGEHRDVLAAYRMFAHDRGWLRRLEAAVEQGLSAEAAVEKVQSETRGRLERTADHYLRERLSDLDDLANRLLRKLLGVAPTAPEALPERAILVARALGPGELLEYGQGRLRGVALEEGSASSHAAIVARALNAPLVVGLKGLIHAVENGDEIIVDGDAGRALIRPDADVVGAYRETLALREAEQKQLRALRDKPAATKDGVRISLQMNAGLLTDMGSLADSGAEGVGLYRTELQYLVSARAPRRDAQTRLYEKVLAAAGDRPVVFRTLDMGGDKQLPFLKGDHEENPAMGWRAIRIALDRPLLFRMQLQALLRAAGGRALAVMFPMIADASEFDRAKALLEIEIARAEREGREPPAALKVGAMLETPALVFAPKRFYRSVDFLSVGGNDLMSFFFAADRGNARVQNRYDPLNCAFLRMLQTVVARCADAQTPLSFCGEMAGKPIEAIALAAIGFRTLSLRPGGVGAVKRALRMVDLAAARAALERAFAVEAETVRAALRSELDRQGVAV